MDEKIDRTDLDQQKNLAENVPAEGDERQEDLCPTEADAPAAEQAEAQPAEDVEQPLGEEKAMEGSPDEETSASSDELSQQGEGEEQPAADEAPEADDSPLVMPAPEEVPAEAALAPAPAPIPAGPAEKLFNGLSYLGLPVLLLFAAAMTFPEVWQVRDLWFSDEVRLADAFMNVKAGDWLVLTMNGLPYPDKPPLYFWFMDCLTRIPGVSAPMALFLGVAISHALFIGSIWALARGTGFDRRVAFASGLVALSCVYISGAACYPRMDLLFAAAVTLGMTCLYRGWIKSFAPFWLALGWLFMAAATLIKGPLGIGFAVVTSVLFLFWRCTPGRLNSRDGLPGFALMLIALAVWLGTLYLDGHSDYIRAMIGEQLAGRVLDGGHHGQVWWYYLAALPIVWVPWILLPLFVNWFRALRGIPAAIRTRKSNGGSSWLWIWLVTGVAMLSLVQAKMVVYALPLFAPMAVLMARSLLNLTAGRSRCFFGLSAAVFAVIGLALVLIDVFPFVREYIPAEWMPAIPAMIAPWIDALNGTMYMGAALIVTAVVLLSLTRLALPGGALLITSFGLMLMLQPYHWFVAPSMTPLLSPRAQAVVMVEKMKEGFAPAAYQVYPGAYAWHVNELTAPQGKRLAVPDIKDEAALGVWLAQHPKTVIAMPEAAWNALAAKPANASVLLKQWMVHKPYVVVSVEAPAPKQDAPVPAAPTAPAETPAAEQPTAPAPSEQSAPADAPAANEAAPAEAPAPSEAAPAPEAPESPAAPADKPASI